MKRGVGVGAAFLPLVSQVTMISLYGLKEDKQLLFVFSHDVLDGTFDRRSHVFSS